jgi:hypothetical protein
MEQDFSSLGQIWRSRKPTKKPPAYPWQDLALEVIKDLGVPAAKRNAVFKVCRLYSREQIRRAVNDTKELAGGDKWKYFFKILENSKPNSKKT